MISLKRNKQNDDKDIVVPETFPGISSYSKIKLFGFFPAVKMDNTNHIYICKTWRYKPLIPVLIIFCGIFFLIMNSIFLFPRFGYEGKIAWRISCIFLILFFITYIQTILIGPGFFPFYWAEQHQKVGLKQGLRFNEIQSINDQIDDQITDQIDNQLLSNNSSEINDNNFDLDLNQHDDESPSGIITKHEQLVWAKSKQRPPRSVISKSAGRIVIRPDHFCSVTLSWIGKRNQKHFILFNLYAALFSFIHFFYAARLIIKQIFKFGWCWHFYFLFAFVTVVAGFQFGGLSFLFHLVSCYHSCKGTTLLEDQMGIKNRFNKGCIKNLEDVCGSCWLLPCWLCPTNPWKNKSNQELVENYSSYYDDSLFLNSK